MVTQESRNSMRRFTKTVLCLIFVVLFCSIPFTALAKFEFNEEIAKESKDRKRFEQECNSSEILTETTFQTNFRIPASFEISKLQNSGFMYCFTYISETETYKVFYKARDIFEGYRYINNQISSRADVDTSDWYSFVRRFDYNIDAPGEYTAKEFGEKTYFIENSSYDVLVGIETYTVDTYTTIHNGVAHSFFIEKGASTDGFLRFEYVLKSVKFNNEVVQNNNGVGNTNEELFKQSDSNGNIMSLIYEIGYYFGSFAIFLVFMISAICIAKYSCCWWFYGGGAAVQLLALIGSVSSGLNRVIEWVIFIVLLLIFGTIIESRRKVAKQKEQQVESRSSESYTPQYTVALSKACKTDIDAESTSEVQEIKKQSFFHSYADMWINSTNLSGVVSRSDFIKAKILNIVAFACTAVFLLFICWVFDESMSNYPDPFWEYIIEFDYDDHWYTHFCFIYLLILLLSHYIVGKFYTARRLKSLGMNAWLALAPLSFFVAFSKTQIAPTNNTKQYTFGNAYLAFFLSLVPFVPLYFSVLRKINKENSID